MSSIRAWLFVSLQKILPRYLLTTIVRQLSRVRLAWFKDFLITRFVRLYRVETEDVLRPVPEGFECFNDFFIRELHDDVRPIDTNDDSIVSPVDGTVSAAGRIDHGHVFQAKGIDYLLTDLLATNTGDAEPYIGGAFATIYLAPYNYHRVHAPVAGELTALRYVPGDLYSVNDATVRLLPGLFVRNERLLCHFATAAGPMILALVGAMNVGTINTIWTGDVRPRAKGSVEEFDTRRLSADLQFAKGDLLGWFNMGSTVILLVPAAATDEFSVLERGKFVEMGRQIGTLEFV